MLTQYKDRFRGAADFLARFFIRLGFSPNGLTLLGLAMGLGACLLFAWNRNPILFGFLMIFCGLFDFVDGAVARFSGRVTKFGSYLDAVSDRFFEAGAILATAFVSGHWTLSFLLLTGMSLVSYTKARAAIEVPISNMEWPDLMERTERDLIFAAGVISWGCFPGRYWGHDVLFWTFVILNPLVYFTVIQRVLRAKRLIETRG